MTFDGCGDCKSEDDVIRELDKVLGDTDIPYKQGHLAWQQNESITIRMAGPDNEILEIDE